MNFGKGVLVRCTAIVLLICICATAVLYVEGVFEFSFIDRQPANENIKPPVTTAPGTGGSQTVAPGTLPPWIEDTDHPIETGDGTEPPDSDESGPEDTGAVTPPEGFAPPTVSELVNGGYNITTDNYTSDMVIAEVELNDIYSELCTGSKFFRDSVLAKIHSDETFIFGDMKMTSVKRHTVETYMGYILIAGEKTVRVYDALGELLLETDVALSPAYTRDKQDRPLFFINANEERFYYIDHEKKEYVYASEYNDEYDNRGLYFDYNPNYGKSDVGLVPEWKVSDFYRYFSYNMSSSWQMNNVSPLIAKELQLMYPRYAALVARFNYRFAAALAEAKKEIAAEEAAKREEESKKAEEESKRAEEESKNAELTKDTTEAVVPSDSISDTLLSPPVETTTGAPSDSNETTSSDITSGETTATPVEPAEITVPEETRSPETDATSSGEVTAPTDTPISSDTVTSPESETDVNPSTDTSTETLTSPAETTASPETTGNGSESVTEGESSTEGESTTGGDATTDSESIPETTTAPEETKPQFPSDSITGTIVIEKKFSLPRYGYAKNGVLSKSYAYARAFAFNDGRAAVIDDDGRLTFINQSYRTAITKYSRFKSTVPGSDVSVYYISSYYAPVYNNMSSLGHFYFDHGYVTVRQVNIESMFNRRAGVDKTYLIDTAGNQVYAPTGYNFISCSEGIMIAERNGRYGYYDVAKKMWIADPIYTYIMPFYEGIGVLGTDGEIGAIDRNGNVVIPFEFEYLSTMSTGLISAYNAEDGWRVFAKMAKTK